MKKSYKITNRQASGSFISIQINFKVIRGSEGHCLAPKQIKLKLIYKQMCLCLFFSYTSSFSFSPNRMKHSILNIFVKRKERKRKRNSQVFFLKCEVTKINIKSWPMDLGTLLGPCSTYISFKQTIFNKLCLSGSSWMFASVTCIISVHRLPGTKGSSPEWRSCLGP